MAYDIGWWRYSADTSHNHFETYAALLTEGSTPEVETLPVKKIRASISQALCANWEQTSPDSWQNDSGAFELSISDRCVVFHGYGDYGNALGKLVDIMSEFHCSAFDPQSGERRGRN